MEHGVDSTCVAQAERLVITEKKIAAPATKIA